MGLAGYLLAAVMGGVIGALWLAIVALMRRVRRLEAAQPREFMRRPVRPARWEGGEITGQGLEPAPLEPLPAEDLPPFRGPVPPIEDEKTPVS